MTTPRKLHVKTLGCQMNAYDSQRIADVLAKSHGLTPTDDPAEADVLLLNTCSIREKAQEKVFSELGAWWHAYKQARPDVIIGVGGCVASQEGERLRARAPYVDLVFGPQTIHRLPLLLNQALGRRAAVDVSFPEIEKFDHLPLPRATGPTAFVSIMEGCSKYCSFCVVPYTRGEEFSRPLLDVLTEIAVYTEQGVREVTLLGQNVNAYRGATPRGGVADLAELIGQAAQIEALARIRFTTSHPVEFTDRLIAAYADQPKLAAHLHLPVQSGSDRILRAMKRGHTAAEYLEKIERVRAARPGLSLTTDIIVGFPGETEDDFAATLALVEAAGFDEAFSFIYSARPGTPAAALPDDTPVEVKKERLARLQALIERQSRAFAAGLLGSVQTVLVEGPAKRGAGELQGRIGANRVVNFAAPEPLIGQLVDVKITSASAHTLRGEPVGSRHAA
ncbi:tRNA (N6-isopentenyl adenosine(37)-C2)-methylthiotransferase MiaB [Immundisolibacter sp.]|uniref:tRNA (N6-isopentenyl adenosine(37)-C2)-methylthiotransferase MiaB n=1 Tax=Immundisolibacter sp. TaxID=1934948 RepID=UPI00260DE4EB|nr:tRNA (N6-isopentenyl adenosine(37)-C2)-methylthiotransferase MiaB [Immundisolibacter sp.]MDD3650733.1 tRNA (N6-isopentenyl adenosine(37)-C2)-methylthiotransferase MiaB [Immundisolibacter sp.]